MPSRRTLIRMSDAEIRDFLAEQKTIILNSLGADGFPHPMPMWFVVEDSGVIRMTTFRKSQKIVNIERDPRVTLLAEDGVEYGELRGVVMRCRAELVRDVDLILETLARAAGNSAVLDDPEQAKAFRSAMRGQAEKRILIRCKPEHVVSWDHSRLGGKY